MSLPKFNLSKLRESVSAQQNATKKDIANLLLLDRLRSQVEKQRSKKRKPLADFIIIDIHMENSSKHGYFYLYNEEVDEYEHKKKITLENLVEYLILQEDSYLQNYFLKEDNYSLQSIESKYIILTIKIPLTDALERLKKDGYSEAEDKDAAIEQMYLVAKHLGEKLNREYNDLSYFIEGAEGEDREEYIKKFNKLVDFIHKETNVDENSFPYLEKDSEEGYELPFLVGLIVKKIEVY